MMDIKSKDYKYLKFLSAYASEQKSEARCRLAALIVHKNMPISMGKNQMKSHPVQARFSMTHHHIFLHAEIAAIIKAAKELDSEVLNKCTLYVCRVLKDGSWALAKPCPGCQAAILAYGIERTVWTIENGFTTSDNEKLDENHTIYENRKIQNRKKVENLHLSKYQHTCRS